MRELTPAILTQTFRKVYPFSVFFLVWALVSYFRVFPEYLIPSPFRVFELLFKMLAEGSLIRHMAISFLNSGIGFVLGAGLGILLGALCATSRGVYEFCMPLISAAYPVPTIVWVPLALLWFGFSAKSLIFVVFLGCFFSVFYNTLSGISNINPLYIRAAKNLNLRGYRYFREVYFWGSFPYILAGLRLAVGQSWRIIVGAEMLASTVKGLGWFLWISSEFFKYDQVFVGMITIGMVGFFIEKVVFRAIEKRTVLKWY